MRAFCISAPFQQQGGHTSGFQAPLHLCCSRSSFYRFFTPDYLDDFDDEYDDEFDDDFFEDEDDDDAEEEKEAPKTKEEK